MNYTNLFNRIMDNLDAEDADLFRGFLNEITSLQCADDIGMFLADNTIPHLQKYLYSLEDKTWVHKLKDLDDVKTFESVYLMIPAAIAAGNFNPDITRYTIRGNKVVIYDKPRSMREYLKEELLTEVMPNGISEWIKIAAFSPDQFDPRRFPWYSATTEVINNLRQKISFKELDRKYVLPMLAQFITEDSPYDSDYWDGVFSDYGMPNIEAYLNILISKPKSGRGYVIKKSDSGVISCSGFNL